MLNTAYNRRDVPLNIFDEVHQYLKVIFYGEGTKLSADEKTLRGFSPWNEYKF